MAVASGKASGARPPYLNSVPPILCLAPRLTVAIGKSPSGMCAKLRTVAASNNRVHPTRSLCYCLFAPNVSGVVLRAYPVRGESHIQCNTSGEVATPARSCRIAMRSCRQSISNCMLNYFSLRHCVCF